MATLHVRSVPEDLYERIQNLAQSRSRSLSARSSRSCTGHWRTRRVENARASSWLISAGAALHCLLALPTAWNSCVRIAADNGPHRVCGRLQRGD
jgi:hypothetical protein